MFLNKRFENFNKQYSESIQEKSITNKAIIIISKNKEY